MQQSKIGITVIDGQSEMPTEVAFSSLLLPEQLEVLFASQQEIVQDNRVLANKVEEMKQAIHTLAATVQGLIQKLGERNAIDDPDKVATDVFDQYDLINQLFPIQNAEHLKNTEALLAGAADFKKCVRFSAFGFI